MGWNSNGDHATAHVLGAPPSPTAEIDVAEGASVSVLGALPHPALVEVLADAPRVVPWEADFVVAVVADEPSLTGLTGWLRECGVIAPVWVVHGSDASEAPGRHEVNAVMRDAGYGELEVSSVSAQWAATHYAMPA